MQERLAYKLRVLHCLSGRMQRLRAAGRAVAVVGDFNIAPTPLDSCSPGPGFAARADRRWLASLLSPSHLWTPGAGGPCALCEHRTATAAAADAAPAPCGGFSDTFRWFHAGRAAAYTCWSTVTGARNHNWGTRIDLLLVADPAAATGSAGWSWRSATTAADIMPEVLGSDHAPAWLEVDRGRLPPFAPAAAPLPVSSAALFSAHGRQASLSALWRGAQPQTRCSPRFCCKFAADLM